MSSYTVEIIQRYPRLSGYPPYKVTIYGGKHESKLESGYATTVWGAKRRARKLIKEIEGKEFVPKPVTTYEVET